MSNCNATTIDSVISSSSPSINRFLNSLNSSFANANASLFVLPSFSSFSPRVEKIDSFFSSSALLRTYSRKGACWFKISCHSAPKSTFVVSPSFDVVVKVVVVLIVSVFTFVGVVLHDDDCGDIVVTDDDWSRCCSRRRSARSRRKPSISRPGFFSRKTSSPLLNALL